MVRHLTLVSDKVLRANDIVYFQKRSRYCIIVNPADNGIGRKMFIEMEDEGYSLLITRYSVILKTLLDVYGNLEIYGVGNIKSYLKRYKIWNISKLLKSLTR